MRANEFISETTIKLRGFGPSEKTRDWVAKVQSMFYQDGPNNYLFWNHDGQRIPKGKEETKDIAAYVQFELVPKQQNKVEVKWIQATPLRSGYGTKAMKILQDLASQDGIALTLFPWDKGQISQSKLTKFYKKQGFKPIGTSKNMLWEPEENDNLAEYTTNNSSGLGAVPNNANVDYMGLRVFMKPSIFLKLARPLTEPQSVDYIVNHLETGGELGAPFLIVDIPESWLKGKFPDFAKVSGHEGRNRMTAVHQVEGDSPVEIHIFPKGLRAKDLTPDIIEQLQVGMISESGKIVFAGGAKLLFDLEKDK